MNTQSLSLQSGMSLLLTTLLIASLISLMIFVLLMVALLETKRSRGSVQSHQAFYAAEGAFADIVTQIKRNYSTGMSADHLITTLVPMSELDSSQLNLDIQSTPQEAIDIRVGSSVFGVERLLASRIQLPSSAIAPLQRDPLDIMLVLDVSGSMEYAINGTTAMAQLKQAIHEFIASPKLQTNDNLGIVLFGETAVVYKPLHSYGLSALEQAIDLINVQGWVGGPNLKGSTNIDHGVELGISELNENASPNENILILFSDGVPQKTNTFQNGTKVTCANDSCYRDTSPYAPLDAQMNGHGVACTHYPIQRADNHRQQIGFFSVFFSSYKSPLAMSACNDKAKTEQLGRETMRQIADTDQFYEAQNSSQLTSIFQDIVKQITLPGSVRYREAIPE